MIIKVEQRHIDAGLRHRCQECPIAMAIQEATGVKVSVYPISGVYFGNKVIIPIHWEAAKFIGDFDAGMDVRPFDFELAWPPAEVKQCSQS